MIQTRRRVEAALTEREQALAAALYPWRVTELRAIQAAWNQRGAAADWTLSDVLSVLIGQEHARLLACARRERADDEDATTD